MKHGDVLVLQMIHILIGLDAILLFVSISKCVARIISSSRKTMGQVAALCFSRTRLNARPTSNLFGLGLRVDRIFLPLNAHDYDFILNGPD